MGTTSLLDIIGSMMTFGLLMLAALRLNTSASDSNYAYNQSYLMQRNMVVLTVLLEQDLNNVGTGTVDSLYGGVIKADTNDLIFYEDIYRSGNPVTVEWKVGLASAGPATPNPADCYVSRIVNGKESKMNLGVTRLRFSYWNIADPTISAGATPIVPPNVGNIGPIEVTLVLQSPFKMKSGYTTAADTAQYQMIWRQIRSISRNTNRQTS